MLLYDTVVIHHLNTVDVGYGVLIWNRGARIRE
jgi:hypothetical protein